MALSTGFGLLPLLLVLLLAVLFSLLLLLVLLPLPDTLSRLCRVVPLLLGGSPAPSDSSSSLDCSSVAMMLSQSSSEAIPQLPKPVSLL
jgi:hypothetical protein